MKRVSAALIVFGLLLVSIENSADAAIKTGTTCKTKGEVKVSNNLNFTCIKTKGRLVWNKGVVFKPDLSPSPTPKPSVSSVVEEENTATELAPKFLTSPEPLGTCRVPDARSSKNGASEAIAYPVTSGGHMPGIPNTGNVNVAIIPIDFPDVPGTKSPSSIIDPEIEQTKKWVKQFSNGKTTYIFQTTNKWIRASKNSNFYIWTHPGHQGNPIKGSVSGPSRTAVDIATELMGYAQKEFDYKNLNIVFFVYPKNVINIYDAITTFGPVQTNIGTVQIQINATGAWLYESNFPIWAWFMHENMHPTGIAGHAPNDGSPFNIMTNQGGASLVLNAWDQAILDWQKDDQIYCVSKDKLEKVDIPLSPLENESTSGTKAIFIKIGAHEVLVVESRRYDYWSKGWQGYSGLPKDFRGLLVYKVDTSIDKNRMEGIGGFAYYLTNKSAKNGIFYGPYSPSFDLNSLIKLGQSLTSNGIKISLVKSGSFDTVQISTSE